MQNSSYVTTWLIAHEVFRIKGKIIDNAEWCMREMKRLRAKGIESEIIKRGRKIALKKRVKV